VGDVGRARLLAWRGQVAEASAALDELLFADPRHLGALLLKASLLQEGREERAALALCARAVAAWPRSAEARNALARGLHALGENERALAEAEEAKRLLDVDEADNALQTGPVYLTLVWCLRDLRLYKEALLAAEEGLLRVPDAILASWAGTVEEELAEAQKEEC
jgi:tetratricopeptide (TPR) repeat protein